MNPLTASFAFGALVLGLLAWRRSDAAVLSSSGEAVAQPYSYMDAGSITDTGTDAWPSMPSGNQAPMQNQNVAAFLAMIRAAEGTAGEGGYGALFGYPAAGRSFDPYSVGGHPRVFFDYTDKAGKTIRTSAAGAYQITWTTWTGYYLAFVAWCGVNGKECSGFTPATQDSFAEFLLSLDGALDYVKAGQLDAALNIARRRWASLPGAGYNQPERSAQYVRAAYVNAGGTIA